MIWILRGHVDYEGSDVIAVLPGHYPDAGVERRQSELRAKLSYDSVSAELWNIGGERLRELPSVR